MAVGSNPYLELQLGFNEMILWSTSFPVILLHIATSSGESRTQGPAQARRGADPPSMFVE